MYLLQTSQAPTLAPVPFHQQSNKQNSCDRNTSITDQPVTSITQLTPKPQNLFYQETSPTRSRPHRARLAETAASRSYLPL
ncbi:hypothetical protein AB0758_48800 [Tolypothrix bouteillei VB521301_2]|uniref:hypothetical protein n=1 Tax=Tolypothrix bouteillei TaxID=1246981 RepID=UPI0038B4D850